jgi:hypothetical protein
MYRSLSRPQGRSGRVWKISPQPGSDPRTVQPIASCHTDWATRSTWSKNTNHYSTEFSSNMSKKIIVISLPKNSNQRSLQLDFSMYLSNLLLVSVMLLFDVYGLFLEWLILAAWHSNCNSIAGCPQPQKNKKGYSVKGTKVYKESKSFTFVLISQQTAVYLLDSIGKSCCFPMSPHARHRLCGLPPGRGWSVTDFWGWNAHEAWLCCPDQVDGDIWIWSTRRGLKPKFYQLLGPWWPWGLSPIREKSSW